MEKSLARIVDEINANRRREEREFRYTVLKTVQPLFDIFEQRAQAQKQQRERLTNAYGDGIFEESEEPGSKYQIYKNYGEYGLKKMHEEQERQENTNFNYGAGTYEQVTGVRSQGAGNGEPIGPHPGGLTGVLEDRKKSTADSDWDTEFEKMYGAGNAAKAREHKGGVTGWFREQGYDASGKKLIGGSGDSAGSSGGVGLNAYRHQYRTFENYMKYFEGKVIRDKIYILDTANKKIISRSVGFLPGEGYYYKDSWNGKDIDKIEWVHPNESMLNYEQREKIVEANKMNKPEDHISALDGDKLYAIIRAPFGRAAVEANQAGRVANQPLPPSRAYSGSAPFPEERGISHSAPVENAKQWENRGINDVAINRHIDSFNNNIPIAITGGRRSQIENKMLSLVKAKLKDPKLELPSGNIRDKYGNLMFTFEDSVLKEPFMQTLREVYGYIDGKYGDRYGNKVVEMDDV